MTARHGLWMALILLFCAWMLLRPREQRLRVDPTPAALATGDESAANRLFAPCPLGPRNIPARRKDIA